MMADDAYHRIMSEFGAEIGRNYIKVDLKMSGLPDGATGKLRHEQEAFIRLLQKTVLDFIGAPETRYSEHSKVISSSGQITEEEIEAAKREVLANINKTMN